MYKARPILVFSEWYVERTGRRNSEDVWVLNPKALGTFLACEPTVLSRAAMNSAKQILAHYFRNPV